MSAFEMLFSQSSKPPNYSPGATVKMWCVFTTHGCVCAYGWDTRRAQNSKVWVTTLAKGQIIYKHILFNKLGQKNIDPDFEMCVFFPWQSLKKRNQKIFL